MSENSTWRKAIISQEKEIPTFRRMLATTSEKKRSVDAEGLVANDIFSKELLMQQKEMRQLNHDIDVQQRRLTRDCECEAENKYDIDTLCSQDILRDRIKAIEKHYIDLKCNFMNYIATLL